MVVVDRLTELNKNKRLIVVDVDVDMTTMKLPVHYGCVWVILRWKHHAYNVAVSNDP